MLPDTQGVSFSSEIAFTYVSSIVLEVCQSSVIFILRLWYFRLAKLDLYRDKVKIQQTGEKHRKLLEGICWHLLFLSFNISIDLERMQESPSVFPWF